MKGGSSADLLDSNNSKIGSYVSVYNATTKRSSFKWTITNSPGVAVESGHATSGVTGVFSLPFISKLASFSIALCDQFLFQLVMCVLTSSQKTGPLECLVFIFTHHDMI